MVTEAKDLAAALKNSHVNNLPENNIKDNINILLNLFKNNVNNIVTKKLTLTEKGTKNRRTFTESTHYSQ